MSSNRPLDEPQGNSSSSTLQNEPTGEKQLKEMDSTPNPPANAEVTQEKTNTPETVRNPIPNDELLNKETLAEGETTEEPVPQAQTAHDQNLAPSSRPATGPRPTSGPGSFTSKLSSRMPSRTHTGGSVSRVTTDSFLEARRAEEARIAANTPTAVKTRPDQPPVYEPLAQKHPGPLEHPSITFGPPMIIMLDLVVPVIIYYTWYNRHMGYWESDCASYTSQGQTCPYEKPEFDKDVLGNTIISFGFGELYILLARVWRLFVHRDQCAPLLSRSKWELDATSWVYAVAMICALIPFVVASTEVIPKLYLYAPACLMTFLGGVMCMTLLPIKLPIGINSHPRGNRIRPFIYYAAEDFIAVDGLQDREFRVRFNQRYEASYRFRRMFYYLTFFWMFGICVYLGCVSALIWKVDFHYAFGGSLGILFGYIVSWAVMTYFYIQWETSREKAMYEKLGHF